jgi:hypothetical protein
MNSGDEDAVKEDHGEVLTGMYAPGCASLEEARLTEEQAQEQRATTSSKEPRVPPRSQSPAYDSSNEDTLEGPEHVWSQTKQSFRKNKAWVRRLAESALALPAPEPERKPTPLTSPVNSDDEWMSEDQRRKIESAKRMATRGTKTSRPPPRSPSTPEAKNPTKEAKASKPTKGQVKGQESPVAKATHPMQTRKRASGAGCLRPGGGSGQTDTCVASGNPSKT